MSETYLSDNTGNRVKYDCGSNLEAWDFPVLTTTYQNQGLDKQGMFCEICEKEKFHYVAMNILGAIADIVDECGCEGKAKYEKDGEVFVEDLGTVHRTRKTGPI